MNGDLTSGDLEFEGLHFDVERDDGQWVAFCREHRGLVTCAGTLTELAAIMIPDAVKCWREAERIIEARRG